MRNQSLRSISENIEIAAKNVRIARNQCFHELVNEICMCIFVNQVFLLDVLTKTNCISPEFMEIIDFRTA